jgi:hypothetical protein
MWFHPAPVSRWAPEHFGWSFSLGARAYYSNPVVLPTTVKGARKVKNFRLQIDLLGEQPYQEYPCVWILYVQKELQPHDPAAAPLIPFVNHICNTLNCPDHVIDAGIVGRAQTGKVNFSPLSRILDSGDSLCLVVQNLGEAEETVSVWVSLGFCICYA